jgi:citrate lyase subunit beta / citryl-CoA lyase
MSASIRPRRSVLYMPGSNQRALEKVKSLPTDCVIFDLEDSVAPDEKNAARDQVIAALKAGGYGPRELIVRTNGLATPWGYEDVAAAVRAGADGVLVPKVSSAEDIAQATRAMDDEGAPATMALWAMIETPLAILNVKEIAQSARLPGARLTTWVLGTNDLAKDTGAHLTEDRLPMLGWLSICVAAASAYGLTIIDGVYNDFRNLDGFVNECEHGKLLGMDGKSLIHPGQIEPCNDIFSPSTQEIEMAEQIIAAFDLPENSDKGAITLNGAMVERLHADMARRKVAIWRAIERLSEN